MSTKRSAGGPRPWTKLRTSFWLRPRRTRTEFGGMGVLEDYVSADGIEGEHGIVPSSPLWRS